MTILIHSSAVLSYEVMKMMYKRGFSLSSDLLSNCIQEGKHDCVEWLLEVLDKNLINLSILEVSRIPVTLPTAKLIQKYGFDISLTLSYFVREGSIEGVQWCQELGLTSLSRYDVHEAIRRDKYDFVEWLISSGWEISREMVGIVIENSLLTPPVATWWRRENVSLVLREGLLFCQGSRRQESSYCSVPTPTKQRVNSDIRLC